MKLIVDMPEEELQHIFDIANSVKELPVGLLADLIRIAANGIPLEQIIDILKKEHKRFCYLSSMGNGMSDIWHERSVGLNEALKIIDNFTKGDGK